MWIYVHISVESLRFPLNDNQWRSLRSGHAWHHWLTGKKCLRNSFVMLSTVKVVVFSFKMIAPAWPFKILPASMTFLPKIVIIIQNTAFLSHCQSHHSENSVPYIGLCSFRKQNLRIMNINELGIRTTAVLMFDIHDFYVFSSWPHPSFSSSRCYCMTQHNFQWVWLSKFSHENKPRLTQNIFVKK